jgi:glycerophosphoryl diester phosphodiesterase
VIQGSSDLLYRPLVFAHRGSSAAFAEHTLDAYIHAIEEGADGVECDIRLTRDQHLVCVHDGRLNRTSDGTGRVSTHTLAELDVLDFGSWHPGSAGGVSTVTPARVLTLDRLLSTLLDARRPIRLLIETKHPNRYGGAVELALVNMLRRYGLDRPNEDSLVRVTVMSFSVLAVRRMRSFLPELPAAMLLEVVPPGLRRLPFGSAVGGPGMRLVRNNPELVDRLHRNGHEVYVWTVNEPEDLELVLAGRVEGIITDRPGYVLGELRRLGLRDD